MQLAEDGEFVAVFAPNAWNLGECPAKAAVLEAMVAFQLRYKMLRFDYDVTDGEVRPNIELPLEDSTITSRQFHRLVHGMLDGMERFDRVMSRTIETGEVRLDDEQALPTADETARLQQLADLAGGVDALEELIGGDEPEADAA